jgi:hypothetical protein
MHLSWSSLFKNIVIVFAPYLGAAACCKARALSVMTINILLRFSHWKRSAIGTVETFPEAHACGAAPQSSGSVHAR